MDTETKPLWTTKREAMGKTWSIELWPDDATLSGDEGKSEYLGRGWYSNQWVRVAANRPLDGRDGTLLHELIHMACKTGYIPLKEAQVSALSDNLYAFLRGFGLWQEFPWPDKDE